MASKIRIHQLAKFVGLGNKALVDLVQQGLGVEVKGSQSTLTEAQADQVCDKVGVSAEARAQVVASFEGGSKSVTSSEKKRPSDDEKVAKESKDVKRRSSVMRRKGSGTRPAERDRGEAEEEAAAEAAAADATPSRVMVRSSGAPSRGTRTSDLPPAADPGSDAKAATPTPPATEAAEVPDAREPASVSTEPAHPGKEVAGGNVAEPKKELGPRLGERIELPKSTRRLPGGMASRLEQEPIVAPAPVVAGAADSSKAPAVAPAKEDASGAPAQNTPVEAVATDTEGDDRGVIRNQEGVIVGIKTKQQGPNITGFIKLEPRKSARQQVIITEAKKGPGGGRATARKKREERAQRMSRNRPQRRDRFRSGPPQINTVEMGEAKRRIRVDEVIQVSDLAHQMGQKSAKIVRELWVLGLRGITINNAVDLETAELVAERFGYTVDNVAFNEQELVLDEANDDEDLRSPVVTVMGHVDHGKTSLLDYIRSADVADGEAGGITQHIGAYRVSTSHGDVVFLDTPGHAAFSSMRSRGVQITDIVVLVVAADDGVMPTTIEAIEHTKKSGTPIIVAINKCDKPDANPGRVKQMFMEHGIVGAEFGGDTEMVEISAKTGEGVDNLLELLALQAEVMDLRAPTDGRGGGVVVEARMDKGRGPVATVLVERGTLSRSDVAVANEFSGKVRGIYDDRGKEISEVGPGTPVEVLGLDGVPSAGDRFDVVENERAAKQLVAHRREKRRRKESVRAGPSVHDLIAKRRIPSVKIVLRADVQGSAEALKESLEALSTEKVRVEVIFKGVGAINENDVKYASAGEAVIIGFNSKPVGKAGTQADSVGVRVLQFSIIYEATERVTELMIDQLDPVFKQNDIGEAEVRQIFSKAWRGGGLSRDPRSRHACEPRPRQTRWQGGLRGRGRVSEVLQRRRQRDRRGA